MYYRLMLLLCLAVAGTSESLENTTRIFSRRSRAEKLLWDADPYLEQSRSHCTGGSLLDCFKSRLMKGLDSFFRKEDVTLTENLRLVRMPESQLLRLAREPYEFDHTDGGRGVGWGDAFSFFVRRVERFVKSTALEISLTDGDTESGRYSPRFIDEIYTELDTINYKNEKSNKKQNLKKLFIPLLIILKLFKLKLLLFLPLILGLASFKKFIGFMVIAVPAVIAYFKLCKPDLSHSYGTFGHSSFYHKPPHIKHHEYYYNEKISNDAGDQTQDSIIHYSPPEAHEMAYSSYQKYHR